jgi:hypothetical protein
VQTIKTIGGHVIALAGAIALLVSVFFLGWYDRVEGLQITGETATGEVRVFRTTFSIGDDLRAWDSLFGTLASVELLAAAMVAIVLALLAVAGRGRRVPVLAVALAAALGIGAVILVALRMAIEPDESGGLLTGIFVALAGAIAVAIGASWSFLAARRGRRDATRVAGA